MDGKEIQSLVNKDAVLKIQFLRVLAADELPSATRWEKVSL